MASMVRRVSACLALGGLAMLVMVGSSVAQEKKKGKGAGKTPTISEIMKKGHAGAKSLLKTVGAQAKEGDWDAAAKGAKTLKLYGEALGKNKPERGDEESWKKLCEEYQMSTAAVAKAVEEKDAAATATALGKIGKSCKGCHDAHK
jgi:hypothetical protein